MKLPSGGADSLKILNTWCLWGNIFLPVEKIFVPKVFVDHLFHLEFLFRVVYRQQRSKDPVKCIQLSFIRTIENLQRGVNSESIQVKENWCNNFYML